MNKDVYLQECDNCHEQFYVRYASTGIEYDVDSPCECESDFSPVDGPSWSQWKENQYVS